MSTRWDHSIAQDNARVQYGHTYIQNQFHGMDDGGRRQLQEDKVELFIKALKFDQMDSRYHSIDPAHVSTCSWLFEKQQYLDWANSAHLEQHHGFLWIKGKAGSGKSTMMKCALEHARKVHRDNSIISFFFNARGHDLEKSVEGLYRSLLVQILTQFPEMRLKFSFEVPRNTEQGEWPVAALRNFLTGVISCFGKDQALSIYVDALDECDEDDMRDSIEHFEELALIAQSTGIQLHLCFASRYYPQITIQHCVEIELEAQIEHRLDIETYVRNKLSIRDSLLRDQLIGKIQQRCSGVFFWVVLVVRMLKKKCDTGACNSEILRTLDEVPLKLQELIARVLAAPDDALVVTMQWMLYAERPLTPEELYFAIQTGAGHLASGAWDSDELSRDAMVSFVLASSRGLVEITKNDYDEFLRAQLVHESVREFLLAGGLASMTSCPARAHPRHGHLQLAQWCQTYVDLDGATYRSYQAEAERLAFEEAQSSDPDLHNARRQEICLDLERNFPLLMYSAVCMFHHLEQSQHGGLPTTECLIGFPLSSWVVLYWIMDLGLTRPPLLNDHPISLVYLLCNYRCHTLLEAVLEANSASDTRDRGFSGANEEGFGLLQTKLDLNTEFEGFHGSLLERAVDSNSPKTVETLLSYGASAVTRGKEAMFFAIDVGSLQTVELLLRHGTSPHMQGINSNYTPAVTFAAQHLQPSIVRLLLDYGADPNGSDAGPHMNPLLEALRYGAVGGRLRGEKMLATIRELLDGGADVNRDTHDGMSPLEYALDRSDTEVAQLLWESQRTHRHQADDAEQKR